MAEVGSLFPRALSRSVTVQEAFRSAPDWQVVFPDYSTAVGKCCLGMKQGQSADEFYKPNWGFQLIRLREVDPAPTISKGGGATGFIHPIFPRKVSGAELRRLGSYPDSFIFSGNRQNTQDRIGNSVPPMFMRAIALQIKHILWRGDQLKPYPKTMDYLEILEQAWQDHLKPKEPDAPTVISTFAGGGGSSLGYSMAGYRELLAVEWDDNAVETFKLNFPGIPVYYGDIAKLSVEECMELAGLNGAGELDLLDGSPPCQGFSTAGKRILNDPRNQLFREFIRLLRGLKPKVFVMENVSGMVKGKMKLVFAEIMRELKASGYKVSARLMNAKYFYVPQSRERMIFIGVREDLGVEPGHPRAESKLTTTKESIGDLPNFQNENIQHFWVNEQGKTKNYDKAKLAKQGQNYRLTYKREYWNKPASTLTRNGIGKPYLANSNCHPLYTRTYSLREYARLASFPDMFVFTGQWGGWDIIGNSVPPLFMRSIAQHIKTKTLTKTKKPLDEALGVSGL